MRAAWSWKEGFLFAFAGELLSEKGSLLHQMSPAEKWGSLFLKPLYRLIDGIAKHIRRPTAIILVTLGAALFSAVVFYNIPAFVVLGKIFPSKLLRCVLFLYVETSLFAIGSRAFGRFNNKRLITLWKSGKLIAIFPGDKR